MLQHFLQFPEHDNLLWGLGLEHVVASAIAKKLFGGHFIANYIFDGLVLYFLELLG